MLQRDYMMVNPQDIAIDMPCSRPRVDELKASIQQVGIVQPIALWLQGMRVIDGFHRSLAAQELGLPEVPAIVVDCDAEAFWDARIQSAKQHTDISDERLAEWVYQCWLATDTAAQEGYSMYDFMRFVYEQGQRFTYSTGPVAMQEWFDEKATRWGLKDWHGLAGRIMKLAGLKERQKPGTKGYWNDGRHKYDDALMAAQAFPDDIPPNDPEKPWQSGRHVPIKDQPTAGEVAAWAAADCPVDDKGTGYTWLEAERKKSQSPPIAQKVQKGRYEIAAASMELALERMGMFVDWNYDFTLSELMAESKRAKSIAGLLLESCAEFEIRMGKSAERHELLAQIKALRDENNALQTSVDNLKIDNARLLGKKLKTTRVLSSTDIEHLPQQTEAS